MANIRSKICVRCGGSGSNVRDLKVMPCPECKGRGYVNLSSVEEQEMKRSTGHYGLDAFGEGLE